MNWEKRWSRRTSTRYTSIIGWKLTTMADSWPTMISRKRGIMSFWRVISEAQFLRTEFLRITTLPALLVKVGCEPGSNLLGSARWSLIDPISAG